MPKDKAKNKKNKKQRRRSIFRLKTLRTIEAALPNKTPLKKPVLTEVQCFAFWLKIDCSLDRESKNKTKQNKTKANTTKKAFCPWQEFITWSTGYKTLYILKTAGKSKF